MAASSGSESEEADEFASAAEEEEGGSGLGSSDDESGSEDDSHSGGSSDGSSSSSGSGGSSSGSASDSGNDDSGDGSSSSSSVESGGASGEQHQQEGQEQRQPGRRRRRRQQQRKISQREDRFLKGPKYGRKRKRAEGGDDEAIRAEEEMEAPDWVRYSPAFPADGGRRRRREKKAAERRARLAGWAFGHFCLEFRKEYGTRILWLRSLDKPGGKKVRRCLTPLEAEAQALTEWRRLGEAEKEKYFKRTARRGRPLLLPPLPPQAPRPVLQPEREDPTAGLYTLEELCPGAPRRPPRSALSLFMHRHGLQLRQARRMLGEMPAWEREALEEEVRKAKAEYPARVRAYCRGVGGGAVALAAAAPAGAAASAASAASGAVAGKGGRGGGKGKTKAKARTKAKR